MFAFQLHISRSAAAACLPAGILASSTLARAQSELDAVRYRFVGVYTLAEYAPHGDEPSGRIWYAANG
jgi:hypothetical protein